MALCRYKDIVTGRVRAVYPGSSLHYREMLSSVRWEDFDIERSHVSLFPLAASSAWHDELFYCHTDGWIGEPVCLHGCWTAFCTERRGSGIGTRYVAVHESGGCGYEDL